MKTNTLFTSSFLYLLFCLSCGCGMQESSSTQKVLINPAENSAPSFSEARREENRYAWQKPEMVIDLLGDLNGKTVADIGAGTGYFTFRLANRADKVIAIDIDPAMINLMSIFRSNLDSLDKERIDIRQATTDNPQLGVGEVDVAIIINTIGYIEDRKTYLSNLSKSLKENGQLMIVDFKMKRIPDNIAPSANYRVSILELEDMLIGSGYEVEITDDRSLDYQYIVRARKVD